MQLHTCCFIAAFAKGLWRWKISYKITTPYQAMALFSTKYATRYSLLATMQGILEKEIRSSCFAFEIKEQ
jgi:hypothetical protein